MSQNLLKNIYLFKDLSVEEFRVIESAVSTDSLQVGDEIFTEGDSATAFYVIKHGSVKISARGGKGVSVDITTLATGSHFGEMAFIDHQKRSATATAAEKTDILRVEFSELDKALAANPALAVKFFHSCAHFLCGRLRATTTDLSFAREKMLSHF